MIKSTLADNMNIANVVAKCSSLKQQIPRQLKLKWAESEVKQMLYLRIHNSKTAAHHTIWI